MCKSLAYNCSIYHTNSILVLACNNYINILGYAGTPGYLSPEVVNKDKYGKAIDVWACGKDHVI